MATERVRMWRPADEDRVLLMAGRTTRYAIEPRGEYVFGIVAGQPMRSRRGRERRLVRPGAARRVGPVGARTPARPSTAGRGRRASWSSRSPTWPRSRATTETDPLADVAFPEPVLADPELARDFVRLHAALEAPARGSSATSGSRSGCAR